MLNQISLYFNKFQNIGADEILIKKSAKDAIFQILGEELESKNISWKNGELKIQGNPALKSEIRINESKIKDFIESSIGRKPKKIS